jgi:hypothetical protein
MFREERRDRKVSREKGKIFTPSLDAQLYHQVADFCAQKSLNDRRTMLSGFSAQDPPGTGLPEGVNLGNDT